MRMIKSTDFTELLKRLHELTDAERSEQRLAHEKHAESGGCRGCQHSASSLAPLPYLFVNSRCTLGMPTRFLISFLLR